jgi:hypothetical protein
MLSADYVMINELTKFRKAKLQINTSLTHIYILEERNINLTKND